MGKVIAKRFIFMIPVVLAVTFIIFMLSFISAGDAARVCLLYTSDAADE